MPRFANGSGNTTRRETTDGTADAGVDQDGDVLDILVQSRPDVQALREDGQLNPHIRVIHMTSRGTYDNPQITGQLRLYLAVALDLFSRRVVG